jgi:pilus assembly protein CpaB
VVHFPEGSLPPNAFHAKSDVVGRGVILPISKGEFILPTKLAGENAGYGLPGLIPPGMRAMSVRVNEVVSVAGFVLPGTRVDVLLTGNPTGAGEQQTTTVLENVAVIAVGPHLERNSNGEPQSVPVITLLVSPDDAQRLTLASTEGRIQLVLRNPLDTRQQDLNSVSTNSLYRRISAPAPVVPAKPRPKRVAVEAPPAPTVYSIEVIRGNKKEDTKF